MEVFEAIYGRRSVRRYLSKPVEDEKVVKVLDAGRWAPSGGNAQPWRFIVVKDEKLIKLIKMISPGMFSEPPVLITICRDLDEAYVKGGEDGKEFVSVADISMAAQNMMLAAHALGLGTCVIRSFDKRAVRRLLEVPDNVEPELLLAVGYPAQAPEKPPRKPLSSVTFLNRYGERWRLLEEQEAKGG